MKLSFLYFWTVVYLSSEFKEKKLENSGIQVKIRVFSAKDSSERSAFASEENILKNSHSQNNPNFFFQWQMFRDWLDFNHYNFNFCFSTSVHSAVEWRPMSKCAFSLYNINNNFLWSTETEMCANRLLYLNFITLINKIFYTS